ncbi:hypothetical protein J6590_078631 [Homalodisca vitripennis]|nr:hypothetical protein J6590_078631 [Homalodisca vitripennis]
MGLLADRVPGESPDRNGLCGTAVARFCFYRCFEQRNILQPVLPLCTYVQSNLIDGLAVECPGFIGRSTPDARCRNSLTGVEAPGIRLSSAPPSGTRDSLYSALRLEDLLSGHRYNRLQCTGQHGLQCLVYVAVTATTLESSFDIRGITCGSSSPSSHPPGQLQDNAGEITIDIMVRSDPLEIPNRPESLSVIKQTSCETLLSVRSRTPRESFNDRLMLSAVSEEGRYVHGPRLQEPGSEGGDGHVFVRDPRQYDHKRWTLLERPKCPYQLLVRVMKNGRVVGHFFCLRYYGIGSLTAALLQDVESDPSHGVRNISCPS